MVFENIQLCKIFSSPVVCGEMKDTYLFNSPFVDHKARSRCFRNRENWENSSYSPEKPRKLRILVFSMFFLWFSPIFPISFGNIAEFRLTIMNNVVPTHMHISLPHYNKIIRKKSTEDMKNRLFEGNLFV